MSFTNAAIECRASMCSSSEACRNEYLQTNKDSRQNAILFFIFGMIILILAYIIWKAVIQRSHRSQRYQRGDEQTIRRRSLLSHLHLCHVRCNVAVNRVRSQSI